MSHLLTHSMLELMRECDKGYDHPFAAVAGSKALLTKAIGILLRRGDHSDHFLRVSLILIHLYLCSLLHIDDAFFRAIEQSVVASPKDGRWLCEWLEEAKGGSNDICIHGSIQNSNNRVV